jgi:small-conductance mechanosensitive channel
MQDTSLWDVIPHLLVIVEFLAFVAVGEITVYLVYRLLAKLAAQTKTKIDDRITATTKRLAFLFVLVASLYTVTPSLGLPDEVHVALYYGLLLLVTMIAARVVAIIIDEAFVKIGISSEKRSVVVKVVKFGIIALGFLGILSCYLNAAMSFFVSVGIIGFVLTFSLQHPLANFIGWIYIMASNVFKVGDRVRVGESYGVVSSINHFTTELAEVNEYDMLSGRVLIVPNSMVLSEKISRWATNQPTPWDSVSFTLAYGSDLKYVEELMLKKVKEVYEELKLDVVDKVNQVYEELAPDHRRIICKPHVFFEPVEGGWISAKLVYLVPLGIRHEVKAALTKKILEAFNADPERVKFPIGRTR